MSEIELRGPWLWVWGAWHVLWVAGILWSGAAYALGLDPTWIYVWFATLYTLFFPLEFLGVRGNFRTQAQDERSIARTLSEFRQFLPTTAGKGPRGVGWRVLGYSGVIDGAIVGLLIYPIWPLVGALVGTIVAIWLSPHFGWRERVG